MSSSDWLVAYAAWRRDVLPFWLAGFADEEVSGTKDNRDSENHADKALYAFGRKKRKSGHEPREVEFPLPSDETYYQLAL